jgi:hypothetical protein
MPIDGAEQHSCSTASPRRQEETRQRIDYTRAMVKKGWPSPFYFRARLRAQIVEWSSWLNLINKFACLRLFGPTRKRGPNKPESKSLWIGENVDQHQLSSKIGQCRELHVVPKRHLVLSAFEALPIGKHVTQTCVELLRQLVWEIAEIPRRPCQAITIKSQAFCAARSMMARYGLSCSTRIAANPILPFRPPAVVNRLP